MLLFRVTKIETLVKTSMEGGKILVKSSRGTVAELLRTPSNSTTPLVPSTLRLMDGGRVQGRRVTFEAVIMSANMPTVEQLTMLHAASLTQVVSDWLVLVMNCSRPVQVGGCWESAARMEDRDHRLEIATIAEVK